MMCRLSNHNYISFRDADGDEVAAIHGFTIDRESGYMSATTLTGDTTLRTVFKTGEENDLYLNGYIKENFPEIIEKYEDSLARDDMDGMKEAAQDLHDVINVNEAIWTGSPEEGRQKLAMAMDTGHFINAQNLDYSAVRVFSESQNSNSVAHTLAKGMDLEVPDDQVGFAPGHDRILLSDNFKSGFGYEMNPMEYTMAIDQLSTGSLSSDGVKQQVLADNKAARTGTFDPEAPLSEYSMHGYAPPFDINDYDAISAEYAGRMDGTYNEFDFGLEDVDIGKSIVSQGNAAPAPEEERSAAMAPATATPNVGL
jgi:hypothetical protein